MLAPTGPVQVCNAMSSPNKILQAFDVTLSFSESCDIIRLDLSTKTPHPTLGLEMNNTLTVLTCKPGTPVAKINHWRKDIKGTVLHSVNDVHTKTI